MKHTSNTWPLSLQTQARIKSDQHHMLYWETWFYFFIACAVLKPPFHLWTHPHGSALLRKQTRSSLEACGSSLPRAFTLGFFFFSLLPAACQGSLLQPRPPHRHFGHGWHSPPLHPSVYSLCHPSINDPFTEAVLWGLSKACSSFWGMQLSGLHITGDLKTSALITPLSCAFFHLSATTNQSDKQVK